MELEYLKQIKEKLEKYIDISIKYRRAKFWDVKDLDKPSKQKLMDKDSFGEFRFEFNNDSYYINSYLRINSKSYSYSQYIEKNGEKRTLKVITAVLWEICDEIDKQEKENDKND